MRMPTDLYDQLAQRMGALNWDIAAYRQRLTAEGRSRDVEKRLRWDMMWAAVPSSWVCENVYNQGMHDAHIDTALKKIISRLENG